MIFVPLLLFTVVHARKSPGTPSQIQTQIHLQAQALVHAHTQAQIQAGIYKGDSKGGGKKAAPASATDDKVDKTHWTTAQKEQYEQLKKQQEKETSGLASNAPPEERQALDRTHAKQRKDMVASFAAHIKKPEAAPAVATTEPPSSTAAAPPQPVRVHVPNPVAAHAATTNGAQPMEVSAPAAAAPVPPPPPHYTPAPAPVAVAPPQVHHVPQPPHPPAPQAVVPHHAAPTTQEYQPPPPAASAPQYAVAAQPAPVAEFGGDAAASTLAQPPPSSNSPAFLAQLNSSLGQFWSTEFTAIQNLTDQSEQDFKNHNDLPLARIKRIMKSDEDVRMISAEAPVLFAKACELFILDLSIRSWNYSQLHKRRTLQKEDIREAIQKTDIFDFLVDVIH